MQWPGLFGIHMPSSAIVMAIGGAEIDRASLS